ncbi:MAG: DUF1284 domain-containing protein [Deltaproteobacteria bacterium]|nr:DUF1284 domain-containing protein [Deltaproteobacteria bacterium]
MEKMQLRAHHVFCERFLKVELPDRGSEFEQAQQKIKDLIETDEDTQVEIIEGVDDLCKVCPDLQDDRCENLFGNEDAVRKWDGIIIEGLGVSYGETMTSGDWRRLIEQKAPLDFCRDRCQWKSICSVFIYVK